MEPSPRWDAFTATVEGKFYTWGGRTKEFSEEKENLSSTLHVFNPNLEIWGSKSTTEPFPPGLYCGSCASVGHDLYIFGGNNGNDELFFDNSLHRLDTKTSKWTLLSSVGPMKKIGSGMITYDNKLLLFGGYGYLSGNPKQPGSEFLECYKYDDKQGWTNELHIFDLKEGTWSSPEVSGTRPPPCSHFSLTMKDEHHAVLFGGYQPDPAGKNINDVYIIDLKKMHWEKLEHHVGEPCPVGRSAHAAVCLGYGEDHPQLLVLGGFYFNKENKDYFKVPMRDAWILDLQSKRWREIEIPIFQPRCYHSAGVFNFSPEVMKVIIFGGCPGWPKNYKKDANVPQIANTIVLRFECPSTGGSREWVLTDEANISKQLGTAPRLRENIEEAARVAVSLERRLSESWVVEIDEIQRTGPEIGRGGWATVSVAEFRGTRVAAKFIHNEIISPYIINLFKREMAMAARIRHPNLLQFIGATLKGEMVILTELMQTSLRKELEGLGTSMSSPLVTSIGLDVVRALNYLHLMRPQPLIHRDISSANVLLEPLPNSCWRAKVSDYGTVNLCKQLQTACPGNSTYAAPEAKDPTKQSPKMDIFSFGVLLMEMLTGELPACDQRDRLLLKINDQPLLTLIQRCVNENKEMRPNACDIITKLIKN